MNVSYNFPNLVSQEVGILLTNWQYILQEEWVKRKPPDVSDTFFLPYIKPIFNLGYAHVVFGHTPNPRTDKQGFYILILRYDGTEPEEALAFPSIGRPTNYLCGYLSPPPAPALPLNGSDWEFGDSDELKTRLLQTRERLQTITLPWLEDPEASMFVQVDKAWYTEPLEQLLAGDVPIQEIQAHVDRFVPKGFMADAGSRSDTDLVSEVATVLRSKHVTPDPAVDAYPYPVVEYLRDCLKGKMAFDRIYYEAMRARLINQTL